MKKILLSVIVLLSILTSFIGCNFKISEDFETKELKRPDVEEDESGMIIRLAVPTSPVNSILIYRYEQEDSSKATVDSAYKMKQSDIIGFINVSKLSQSENFSYYFKDKNIEIEKKYEYRARYTYTDSSIQYSKWSNSVFVKTDHDYKQPMLGATPELNFYENEMKLIIPTDCVEKDEETDINYEYSIIFRAKPDLSTNTEITQLFELSSETILLTKLLPKAFLEAEGGLWIDGIINNTYLDFVTEEINEDDSTKEIKFPTKIGFSKKIPIKIGEKTSTDKEGIQIVKEKIEYGDNSFGIDYSKQAIKLQ